MCIERLHFIPFPIPIPSGIPYFLPFLVAVATAVCSRSIGSKSATLSGSCYWEGALVTGPPAAVNLQTVSS